MKHAQAADDRRGGSVAIAVALGAAALAGACSTSASKGEDNAPIKTVVLSQAARAKAATPAPAMPGKNVPAIKVNTVGYEAGWRKLAIFNVEPKQAVVKDAKTGAAVLAIGADKVVAKGTDAASQDPVWQVDFSALNKPGKYRISGAGADSDPFTIGSGLYAPAVVAGLKSFYFQRCRTALVEPYASWENKAFARKGACHAHDEVGWDLNDYPKKKKRWKQEGGWHDAGNFDMYIPSTAVAAQTLLLAYEWAPAQFPDKQLTIPESGNGASDLLDETKYGLVWILSLQEPGGAFRHRDAMIEWSPEGAADADKTVRWVGQVSSSATAKAVAVLALAARLYDKDKAFAARAAEAAKKGWGWLSENPKHVRAARVGGGEQPLWDDEPENNDLGARFVAATEVWRSFRDPEALKAAKRLLATAKETKDAETILEGAWANISRFGLWTLATDKETAADVKAEAKKRLVAAAELMRARVEKTDGYRCASALDDYYWASNSNLMEKVHVLMMAARLEPESSPERGWLVEAARDQWHWILGRNPNGYSMITRVGKGPDRFYHMEWGPMEPPPPGFLVDGPNSKNAGWLAPGAPAKALLWDNPRTLRSGLAPGSLWHWRQSDLWDGGFVGEGEWGDGWWTVVEPDILYSANFVVAGATML
jgi:endoglucanase